MNLSSVLFILRSLSESVFLFFIMIFVTNQRIKKREDLIIAAIVFCIFYLTLSVPAELTVSLYLAVFIRLLLLFVFGYWFCKKPDVSLVGAFLAEFFSLFSYTFLLFVFMPVMIMPITLHPVGGITYSSLSPRVACFLTVSSIITYFCLILLLRKPLKNLYRLDQKYKIWILLVSVFSILLISFLLLQIQKGSVVITQILILSILGFIFLSELTILLLVSIHARLQSEKLNNDVLLTLNHSVRQGYEMVAEKNEELRKVSHDFRNHLLTMQNLPDEEVKPFIEDLLHNHTQQYSLSHNGDPIIDAVLNSKITRAEENEIELNYFISYPKKVPVSPSDTCAIIANQMDNAIEACMKLKDPAERKIRFSIEKKGDFISFTCENTIIPDSVRLDQELQTTKSNNHHIHGYGIKSIQACVERNHGALTMDIRDNWFISRALIQIE